MQAAVESKTKTALESGSIDAASSSEPVGTKSTMKIIGFVALVVSLIVYTVLFYVLYPLSLIHI